MPRSAADPSQPTVTVERTSVIRFRWARHQLDREPASLTGVDEVDLLDYGVQDTGPDGARWALALRGLAEIDPDDLALAWTLRGAPHAYRRADLSAVAVATAPFSEDDAAKRVFDAAKPLREAGIDVLDALAVVAGHLRDLATRSVTKGDASGRLAELVDDPYLRFCRPCNATHVYEQPFRIAALQAGLELEPGTSPPVLRRVTGLRPARFRRAGTEADAAHHVVRNHLRFYGPARAKDVATFLDAALGEVVDAWPQDVTPVQVAGESAGRGRGTIRSVLDGDVDALTGAPTDDAGIVRLLGPFDPYLQVRDRELLVPDAAHRKELWRTLGRPGAVARDGEVIGTWRPRASGRRFRIEVEDWSRPTAATREAIEVEGERLATHRGLSWDGITRS